MRLLGFLLCSVIGHRQQRTRVVWGIPGVTVRLVDCERCGGSLEPEIGKHLDGYVVTGRDLANVTSGGQVRMPAEPLGRVPEVLTFTLARAYESALQEVLQNSPSPNAERADPRHSGLALDRALARLNLAVVKKERA